MQCVLLGNFIFVFVICFVKRFYTEMKCFCVLDEFLRDQLMCGHHLVCFARNTHVYIYRKMHFFYLVIVHSILK